MKKSEEKPPVASQAWEPKFPFDLVVAYEDRETRHRALHLYDYLAQQLLDDYDFQCSWWRLDLLKDSALLEEASEAAAQANMVVISMRAAPALSADAQSWLDLWLPRRAPVKGALVALLGGSPQPAENPDPVKVQLHNAARLARMDFFLHRFELNAARPRFDIGHLFEHPVQEAPAPLPGKPRPPRPSSSHWGINE